MYSSYRMFSILQYGRHQHQRVLLGYVKNYHTMTILSQILDEEEGIRRMSDNSALHTTLYDPSSKSWWSIYSSKSLEKEYATEIPCTYLTMYDTDGWNFSYKEYGIPDHVWQHIVGTLLTM